MPYYFRLPNIDDLTLSQQAALNETEQIALSGGPGTGKSVVSLYRHLANHGNGSRSLLITYTTTLARYLSECCRLRNPEASRNVRSAYAGRPKRRENFSEIIIDEAQDYGAFQFDVLKTILNSNSMTILGDIAQGVHYYRGIENWQRFIDVEFSDVDATYTFKYVKSLNDPAMRTDPDAPYKFRLNTRVDEGTDSDLEELSAFLADVDQNEYDVNNWKTKKNGRRFNVTDASMILNWIQLYNQEKANNNNEEPTDSTRYTLWVKATAGKNVKGRK